MEAVLHPLLAPSDPSDAVRDEDRREVARLADLLLAHLNEPAIAAAIARVHRPRGGSHGVQAVLAPFLREMGFQDESKGLFAAYKTKHLRPDFYRPVGGSGILLEVERGKTVTNNMDLLDFWKCHLCENADWLFLLVPRLLKHNEAEKGSRVFDYVVDRLSTFFVHPERTDVRGVYVFGY